MFENPSDSIERHQWQQVLLPQDVSPLTARTLKASIKAALGEASREDLFVVIGIMHHLLHAANTRDLHLIADTLTPNISRSRTYKSARSTLANPVSGKAQGPANISRYVKSLFMFVQSRFQHHHRHGSKPVKPPITLSPRERTVLVWMKEGKTNWEIAKILGLSERTVRFHVGSIFEKLGVTSRTQAVARALGSGLIAS